MNPHPPHTTACTPPPFVIRHPMRPTSARWREAGRWSEEPTRVTTSGQGARADLARILTTDLVIEDLALAGMTAVHVHVEAPCEDWPVSSDQSDPMTPPSRRSSASSR